MSSITVILNQEEEEEKEEKKRSNKTGDSEIYFKIKDVFFYSHTVTLDTVTFFVEFWSVKLREKFPFSNAKRGKYFKLTR